MDSSILYVEAVLSLRRRIGSVQHHVMVVPAVLDHPSWKHQKNDLEQLLDDPVGHVLVHPQMDCWTGL